MNEQKMEEEKTALKGRVELLLIRCDGPVKSWGHWASQEPKDLVTASASKPWKYEGTQARVDGRRRFLSSFYWDLVKPASLIEED